MKTSLMNHVAEVYFRLQPKPSEAAYDAQLREQKRRPEKRALPPRPMKGHREEGPDGSLFYFHEREDGPVIFYCHGGAYIHDFSYFHWRFMQKLMDRTGATVVAAGYRLAPYGTWAEAFGLILPAYIRFARAYPKRKLILMGDSAGGGLAAALALELIRLGERAPDELVLLSPWMDVNADDPAIDPLVPADPWLTPTVRACGRWWAGEAGTKDPRVSPAFGPLERLRHVTIFAGTREILNPDSVKLFEKLDPSKGNELIVGEGMFHVYPLLPIPEARPAVERIVEKITQEREDDHGRV